MLHINSLGVLGGPSHCSESVRESTLDDFIGLVIILDVSLDGVLKTSFPDIMLSGEGSSIELVRIAVGFSSASKSNIVVGTSRTVYAIGAK